VIADPAARPAYEAAGGRDLRPLRAALVRRLGGGPAGGPGRDRRPVLGQGVRGRPAPAPVLRAAGADLVLLLAALHRPSPGRTSPPGPATSGWSRSSRSTPSASSTRRSRPAPGSSGSTRATCGRSLVDPDYPLRSGRGSPTIVSRSRVGPASPDGRPLAGRRLHAALGGEALVRAADPRAAAAAFVAAAPCRRRRRRPPHPAVKICGIVDEAGSTPRSPPGPMRSVSLRGRHPPPSPRGGCRARPPGRAGRQRIRPSWP